MARPVRFARITNPFGAKGKYASSRDRHGGPGHHTGIDFGSLGARRIEGAQIRSATPGWVVIDGYNSTMGHWVGIWYGRDDVTITYWHMAASSPVRLGQWVPRGALLGRVGSTGNSTAPHLHVQANRGRGFSYAGHIAPGPWVRGLPWAGSMLRGAGSEAPSKPPPITLEGPGLVGDAEQVTEPGCVGWAREGWVADGGWGERG